jgi:arsenate reductase
MGSPEFEVQSAGTEQTSVRPEAVEAMRRLGIDIRSQTSKTLDQFITQSWDYVITVCDQANEACPFFPSCGERIHWSFADPSAVEGSVEARQKAFDETALRLADTIRTWISSSAR